MTLTLYTDVVHPLSRPGGDVALLGGSFAPLGGQNLIEAAACGCPLLLGPHTFNFAAAAEDAIAAAAARRVPDLPAGVPVGVAVRSRRHDRWADDVARSLGLPLWTVVTRQRALDDHLSAGLGPLRRGRSPLRRAAGDVLREVAAR